MNFLIPLSNPLVVSLVSSVDQFIFGSYWNSCWVRLNLRDHLDGRTRDNLLTIFCSDNNIRGHSEYQVTFSGAVRRLNRI